MFKLWSGIFLMGFREGQWKREFRGENNKSSSGNCYKGNRQQFWQE